MLIKEVEPSVVRNRQTAVTGVIGHAILGDHDLGRRIIPLDPGQYVVEPTRIDLLPACSGERMALQRLAVPVDNHRGVVIDSKKVDRGADGGQVTPPIGPLGLPAASEQSLLGRSNCETPEVRIGFVRGWPQLELDVESRNRRWDGDHGIQVEL